MSEYVKCRLCKWRGKRTFRECQCDYDYCTHSGYGKCPKCKAQVETVKSLREEKEALAKYEEWSKSSEGQKVLASFTEGHNRKLA